MSVIAVWAGVVVAAYLLGSVSFSYLFVRRLAGRDVRTVGSGNAGATNVLRISGRWASLLVLVLDAGKGAGAIVAARLAEVPGPIVGAAALAAVVGHIFPLYLGFRGGKGVATAAGCMGILSPPATGLAIVVFLAFTVATRYVAIGSVAAVGLFPLLTMLSGRLGWWPAPPEWLVLTSTAIAALIVGKHAENFRRLREGTEWKLGSPDPTREAR